MNEKRNIQGENIFSLIDQLPDSRRSLWTGQLLPHAWYSLKQVECKSNTFLNNSPQMSEREKYSFCFELFSLKHLKVKGMIITVTEAK